MKELEKIKEKKTLSDQSNELSNTSELKKNNKVYINLKALDKITAKTSTMKVAVGEKKFFGHLIFIHHIH